MKNSTLTLNARLEFPKSELSLYVEILHTQPLFTIKEENKKRYYLHGVELPEGYHVEVSCLNRAFTDEEISKFDLKKLQVFPSRKETVRYLVHPDFQPTYFKTPADAATRFALWVNNLETILNGGVKPHAAESST